MVANVEKTASERAWWIGSLPYLLVVVLATGSFGLIGGVVVAGVVWWMGRWRRVQIVAFWILIPCLLLTFLVAQSTRKQRIHEVAAAVLAPGAPEPAQSQAAHDAVPTDAPYVYDDLDPKNPKNNGVVPPLKYEQHPRISVAGTKDWDVSVAMFMADNPSVLYASNGVIFDEKLAENASIAMSDADRLRTAYLAAVKVPQWTHRPVGADLGPKAGRRDEPRCVQRNPGTGHAC